jgi:NAD(P)-dependent dehydrogenase (short-subunit alcohol dehydrogenase family)
MSGLPATPSFSLAGRRALVTGAGRGIGEAAAVALAQAGAHVTLCARSAGEIGAVASAIRDSGGEAEAEVLDVCDFTAAERIMKSKPAFDILVSNAGTNRPKAFTEVSADDYDSVMDLNVRAAFFIAQIFARRLIKEKRGGVIINVTSQMGHVGAANRTIYCASKFALEGLTKALGVELAKHGIRVNALAPTFIETPMARPFLADPAFRDSVLEKIKLGRLGQVEDLMGAIVFLASDCAALMTGSSLVIDGGWTAE